MARREARASAEERLIRLSAETAARRRNERERAMELAATVSWSRLLDALRERRLLPTLGPRLLELASERADAGFEAALAESLETTRRQAALVQLISARVQAALAEAGIRSAPLKGPQLGEALYGDAGRRLSSDIDLLVPGTQLQRAVAVVRELGYAPPSDPRLPDGMPLLHFALVHQRNELPPVELHWRIHWYESAFAHDRLLPPAIDSGEWRPAPADELIALLLYYARDGLAGLRHPTDIGAWWDGYGGRLAVADVERSLRPYPALQTAALAAARAAEAVVGLPAAELVGGELRLGARGRAAVRLTNPLPHSGEAQVFADMGLIDGLLTPFGGWRDFFRRQVAPPRSALPHPPGAPGKPASRLGHATRVLGRYTLTMAQLLRPGGPAPSGSR
ncbi:MAG TPA: nucleotidyltransferase family protein [Solirubrobacterales bacterium]